MACDNCKNRALKQQAAKNNVPKVNYEPIDCDYDLEKLQDWNNKLNCFKEKSLFKQYNVSGQLLNKYMGIVLSALNSKNPCYFKEKLDQISSFILIIDNSNKCTQI